MNKTVLTRLVRGIVGVVVVAATSACVAAGSVTAPPAVSTASTGSPAPTIAVPTPNPASDCGTLHSWVDYAPFTVSTLAAGGSEFVVGEVMAVRPSVFNTADGQKPADFPRPVGSSGAAIPGNTMIVTPVDVQVDQVLAGSVGRGALRVVVEGGTVGCYSQVVDAAPRYELGKQYVFTLAPMNDSKGVASAATLKVTQAWPLLPDGTVQTVDGAMSVSALQGVISKATSSRP